MAELTIYTASRSLQGKEVRERFDSTFADLYHDLDMGFTPINFMMPWAPLPQNRKRDRAQKKMADTYRSIIEQRRKEGNVKPSDREEDMIWNLMNCSYKDGTPLTDREIAHMMIALLMAGQHSSSATICWIFLRLASRPDIQDELLQEQKDILGVNADGTIKDLTYENLSGLPLHNQVVKETLRLHAPIHSILRKVKSPMPVEGTRYVIPTTHSLLAAPGATSKMDSYFPQSSLWEPHRWDESPAEKYAHLSPAHLKEGVAEEKEDYGYGLVSKGAASPYLPFGAGRHRCIGEQFAYTQLQTIMATVIRDFRFTNVDGSDKVVGTDYSSLFSRPLSPAVVRWERREKK
jgi:sterol 14-demethylase